MLKLPDVLDTVTKELNIHKLCDLIYEISVKVAEGYNKYKVVGSNDMESRVLLFFAVK